MWNILFKILQVSGLLSLGNTIGEFWDDTFGDSEQGKAGVLSKIAKVLVVAGVVYFIFKFFGRKILNMLK